MHNFSPQDFGMIHDPLFAEQNFDIKKEPTQYMLALFLCRGTRIRTWDPLLPKQVR